MELRHLRYFVAVAELRSVRAASEQLHVTQPALSRQIHDLEDAIGVALFERTSRGLVLTTAGETYLSDAREILSRVDAANRLARQIASGLRGHLRIGFVENAAWSDTVSDALRGFEQAVPHVSLELQVLNTPEQLEAIAAGRLDGGFCYRVSVLPEGIASVAVLEQNVVLAVPETWTLGEAGTVSTSELRGLPFIAFPRHAYPAYYDRLIAACAERGLTLDIRQEAATETAILSLVSAGIGAAIVNAANRDRPPARVRFVDLQDLSIPLPLEFCFIANGTNGAYSSKAALHRFVELLG
jgi:DNA-binding transcriptional LysR family regulator